MISRTDPQIRKLQEYVDDRIAATPSRSGLRLLADDKLSGNVRSILSLFDEQNKSRLLSESRRLADGGTTSISNVGLPVTWQRTVLREALSDLRILDLVNVMTDPTAQATTQIPYEVRSPGAILNDGIVYEGQAVPRASIQLKMDLCYINATKLAFSITDEVAHFGGSMLLGWDALGRSIESNARLVKECICTRICNEMQRSADAFGAVEVVTEDISGQLDGSASLIKLAHWPVVRPFQTRSLEGTAIGEPENPITLTLDGSPVLRFDGTGKQAAGVYWAVENYTLGFIRTVDETGAPTTPAPTTATIGYWYATNVKKFDAKIPDGEKIEEYLNGAVRALTAQMSWVKQKRYVVSDFVLTNPIANNTLSNASMFWASNIKRGSMLGETGDVATIASVPVYDTNIAVSDMGDQRVLMGMARSLSYVVAKPFLTGDLFNDVDADGRPLGSKSAYGVEYSVVKVPKPLRSQLTSVILYNSDEYAAAA